ncbi:ABC transporter permease, partial [Bacteroides acidifaciens]|uniref:ABC transporter permease n=1 Tax=Bacteroides acidifaciens TaxID=85831 RepID=UPI00259BE0D7
AVVFAVLMISGIGISIKAVLVLPTVMLVQYILVLGITLTCSAISVYYRDMEQIFGILSVGLMYASPVVYSMNSVPQELHGILNSNPMTVLIIAYRDILFYKQVPDLKDLFIVLLESLCVIIVGWCIFEKLQRRFVEEF